MRNLVRFAVALTCCAGAFAPSQAQPPAGFKKIYDAPTTVNLAGRPVVVDIALHADMNAAKAGDLKLALTTDVTEQIAETKRDLLNWIAARREECGQRWSARDPYIGFPADAIRFTLEIELEYWTCGRSGKGERTRVARESGKVDVTLIPYVDDGKLQARLGDFSIDERSGVSKYIPLEFVIRGALGQELKKLNENPKFYRAPKPFLGEGFKYQSIAARTDADGRVVITARYGAEGSAAALKRVVAKIGKEGVSQ